MPTFAARDFWIKGRLFINRAMEPGDHRSEDEKRLWASLALEQLAKWALAETSPVLVADPVHGGGVQILKALGLKEGGTHVTVSATTAFERCAQVYRPFSAEDAKRFSDARNEYLHGPDVAVMTLPSQAWWMRYWSLVNVLLSAHSRAPGDLVGARRASVVEEHLARSTKWIAERAEALLAAAVRNLKRYEDGQMTADEQLRWLRISALGQAVGLKFSAEAACPACGVIGLVESDYAERTEMYHSGDPEDYPTKEVYFFADYFSCRNCHLVLDSPEVVEAAGLTDEFSQETDEPYYDEPEYGND